MSGSMNGLADELRLALDDEILHLTGLILSQENMARYLERRQVEPRPVDGRPVRLFRIDAQPKARISGHHRASSIPRCDPR
jgi:hypothetical protein